MSLQVKWHTSTVKYCELAGQPNSQYLEHCRTGTVDMWYTYYSKTIIHATIWHWYVPNVKMEPQKTRELSLISMVGSVPYEPHKCFIQLNKNGIIILLMSLSVNQSGIIFQLRSPSQQK